MAAQDEREPGGVISYMCSCLGPMAQKTPMQEQIPPQMDLEPEMGAAAAEAAVCDTPHPHLRQIPSPTPQ